MLPTLRVLVTGGAGQIAYSLLFRIGAGAMFGSNQPIALHVMDLPGSEAVLAGLKMELEDCAFPLLKEIKVGTALDELMNGVDYAILVGSKPRGPGMERKDLLEENGKIFVEQGKALNQFASRKVKVLVVGNPCNTNCLIAMHHARDLPKEHFFAMTRLDQNRAVFQLAAKAGVSVQEVKHLAIWGNHSTTQVPDFANATIQGREVVRVIHNRKWLEEEFLSKIQKRGAEVIAARGKSSAASAANAIIDAIRSIVQPTEFFSMGVSSFSNPYGIAPDLIFSFPCSTSRDQEVSIVGGLNLDPFIEKKIRLSEKELIEEKDMVRGLL
jgi:malate dehydrogenase